MQLDVFSNPIARARRAFPYVVVLQADIAASGSQRMVAFLAAKAHVGKLAGRLTPVVQLGGREFVLLMPFITNPSYSRQFRKRATDVARSRDLIDDSGCEAEASIGRGAPHPS